MFKARVVSSDFPGTEDLIAVQTAAGGLTVKNESTGYIARRIAPSTVKNKGGFLEALQFAYPTGTSRKYWYSHIVILTIDIRSN